MHDLIMRLHPGRLIGASRGGPRPRATRAMALVVTQIV
jgi:hypothetical protein